MSCVASDAPGAPLGPPERGESKNPHTEKGMGTWAHDKMSRVLAVFVNILSSPSQLDA